MDLTEPALDDGALDALLGAYALDACEPVELEAIEAYLARTPRANAEVERLRNAAAWIGASEALAPPLSLRESVVTAARVRRASSRDDAAATYVAETDRLDALLDSIAERPLDAVTFNGLTARELAIHLAAMETLAAASVGEAIIAEATSIDVEDRTAWFVAAFAGRSLAEIRDVWRSSVDAVRRWAARGSAEPVNWLGFEIERETLLIGRAFETWTHADDLRRALGLPLRTPAPVALHAMADLSLGALDIAMTLSGRSRPGRTARVVLTGPGGGRWLVPLAWGETPATAPDVELRADVVDWCLAVGERLSPPDLELEVRGDESLVADVLVALPAFATL